MVKIQINHECTDTKELSVLLRHIADMIDKGEMYGYTPTWTITDISEKQTKISYIKETIQKWGETTSAELELNSSPVYDNLNGNICSLVERFNNHGVDVITYNGEDKIDVDYYPYEDLSADLIDEIHLIIESYDLEQQSIHEHIGFN